jgi:DNA-binding PadR family transcriptional regulator
MKDKLPRLPHLQFLVLGVLRAGPLVGREVRERLAEFGARTHGPGFYQLMSRLEDGGMVEGEYRQQVVEGQIIRERHYRITGAGAGAWQHSCEFYLRVIGNSGQLESPAGA